MGYFSMAMAAMALALSNLGAQEKIAPKLPVKERVWVTVVGTLHLPDPNVRSLVPIDAYIDCGDQKLVIRGGSKDLWAAIRKFDGKRVVLSGWLSKGSPLLLVGTHTETIPVLNGTGVQAAGKDDKAGVTVSLTAKLEYAEGKSLPPVQSWTVTVDGQTFDLSLTANQKKVAKELKGKRVFVTGKLLKDGTVQVDNLMPEMVGCGLPN